MGLSSLFFTHKFENAKIFSIEPELSNFDLLVKNTKDYSHIHPINAALWEKDQYLNVIDHGEGNASFQTSDSVLENTISKIQGISMESFMTSNKIDRIDLLKIDIEGSEFELFNSNNLNWIDAVDHIAIEIHDNIKPGATKLITEKLGNKYNQVQYGEYILFSKK
jgi:FkbM family methyltransferase